MEAAIAWLVQTILATLLIDKMEEWIRRVGLANDVEKLKSEITSVKMVVCAVKGRGIMNESLDESLALLQERLYEADDVVDELDYYRLQELVEGARLPADPSVLLPSNLSIQGATRDEPEGMLGPEQIDEISRGDDETPSNSLRSMVWEHFTITEKDNGNPIKAVCRHCNNEFKCDTKKNGTSSMKKHLENEHSVTCAKKPPGARLPNPSSTDEPIVIANSSRRGNKRRSKAWDSFHVIEEENGQPIKSRCKYCLTEIKCGPRTGTAGMLNHDKICKKKPGPSDQQTPNPSSTGDVIANAAHMVVGDSSSRKKRRVNEESAHITPANTHTTPCDKATLSNRIQEIIGQLQIIRGQVCEVLRLHGSDISSSSNQHQNTTLDQHLRTSSLAPRNVYGRVEEKNSVLKMITEEKSGGVVVLPIVGIAGVGKTTLAQLVYNDPYVEHQFDQRIWVWVSHNFDEVRLTREMLNSISGERHEEINCFAKLQEILKSHANSKRLLVILDDVWDDMNDNFQWDKILAPLVSSHVKGNVILVTTRNMSVAQRLGTLKPVKLGALANDDFWLLFKSCAFGYENCEEHQSLSIIGRQIAEKLKCNPLAAVSTGGLLRKKFSTDYWRNILKNEDWKSMQHSRGIMAALKLSYDQLPYHLQQCFSYCSIFPDSYQFLGDELVGFWISQGFVKGNNFSQGMEEVGRCYLIDLVNLGFFQEVRREESYLGTQVLYAISGLMHDFAMMVSRTDCASIDGLRGHKMPRTLRHLSIVTGSAYRKDQHGNIFRDEKFEETMRNAIPSVSKLRTLVLLGHYDYSFLQVFQHIFKEAHNLRVLHLHGRSADFVKRDSNVVDGACPQVLSKLYHLQVLVVGSYTDPTIPDGINDLVSLRHLIVHKVPYSSIATIDNTTSFQEPHGFQIQISNSFEITQLQSTDELEHWVWVHVNTLKEAYEEILRNNELLEKLHLFWKEPGVELLPMDESRLSFEPSIDTTREVLDGLEPCQHLKILQISGYSDATSPSGFASITSVTSLQTLRLYGCGRWRSIPSLERFPFLTKLKLNNLPKVIQVLVPSVQELVLVEMPKLQRCSCTSVEGMSSSLRALQIEGCQALREFDLFENDDKFEVEQRPWLPGLRKLILRDCPELQVLKPLPPSAIFSDLLINGVSILPDMKGSSSGNLHIGYIAEDGDDDFDEHFDQFMKLDDTILAFHNLRNLTSMVIDGCKNLRSFSFKGFSHLISLKSLEIYLCEELFSPDVMRGNTVEEAIAANCRAFPSLESLSMEFCGIAGKWLSLMLQHAPNLEELSLENCPHITTILLPTEEEENSLSTLLISAKEDSSSGNQDNDALTGLAEDRPLHMPLNLISSLKKITIGGCPHITFNWSNLSIFTSLEKLRIWDNPELFSSLVHRSGSDDQANGGWLLPTSLEELELSRYSLKTLQLCFPSHPTSFKKLEVCSSPDLESLQLLSCTALKELEIRNCGSLTTLEGLQSLGNLRNLTVYECLGLSACLGNFSRLCPRLEGLFIDDPSVLATSFCKHLTSLRRLQLAWLRKLTILTDEQERALVLLKSLQVLRFYVCTDLIDLPAGLHNLPSLKILQVDLCRGISRLPETGLPLQLEQLEIKHCSKQLADQCRLLETSKLKVIIGYVYM